ncbi:MAG: DHH family phosphoesterase [Erysipelotrichales bacterium]|nr:DHH family phosphoesterase [Erysipelotrichales bacterium]
MNFKEKVLNYFNLNEEEYKYLTRSIDDLSLPSFDNFQDMNKANEIIKKSVASGEKIVIYGDYDCDGIMATSILVKCFQMLDVKVGYYIPSRYIDGYGLNEKRVHDFYEKGYKLIITVDNGIAQFDAIKKANELGMKVIVTDHHEMQDKLPEAEVVLHPLVSNYGEVVCCGAYVAFMLASKLLNRYDEYLLSLASIATISDMMQLKAYNRDIVRLGINMMNKNKYRNITLLTDNDIIDENTIGMKIAPKINAIGRMVENTSVNVLIEFMTTSNIERLEYLANFINDTNEKRKKLTKDTAGNVDVDLTKHSIVLVTDLKEGIIGLLANNLLNKYKKPTIILTKDAHDESILKGSARSKRGLAINEFLLENKDILITSGGHEQAGGLSLYINDLDDFIYRFEEYAKTHPFLEEKEDYLEISITDINEDNYKFLRSLAPFGEGFKLPLLKISDIKVSSLAYSKSRLHILYPLSVNQKIVGFNYSKDLLSNYDYIDIYGELGYSVFNGKESFDFNIKRICDKSDMIISI